MFAQPLSLGHGTAVQPELHRVPCQTLGHYLLQVGVVMQEPVVGNGQLNSGGSQGGTGHEEGFNSSLVRGRCGPALRERAETIPVARCPVARQGLQSVPA